MSRRYFAIVLAVLLPTIVFAVAATREEPVVVHAQRRVGDPGRAQQLLPPGFEAGRHQAAAAQRVEQGQHLTRGHPVRAVDGNPADRQR